MNKRLRLLFFTLVGIIFLSVFERCYYDNEQSLYEYYYQQNVCDTVNMTYDADIKPIIDANCAISGCHISSGTGNGIFENYAGVKDKVINGKMRQRVLVFRDMPPVAPLTRCELDQFASWLDNGAPER